MVEIGSGENIGEHNEEHNEKAELERRLAFQESLGKAEIEFFPFCFDQALKIIIESSDVECTLGEIYIRTVEEVLRGTIFKRCNIIQLYENRHPCVMKFGEKYLRAMQLYVNSMS